ncbi:Gfo/Idh/MocA family oxidoreductase [Marinilongibacter aquaticus]|uniref:Gfo/Idh/MocA family protein n=1 Tax=Marinilongibacter aquaticus TaxID=2975157 RepID=UPI0021BD96FA|nr:Gfo/Idh/MocA family oxidoreductase [Marinilongibacter aquaticus]UBM58971.1 Gfo/Idh/MocA family oxidoreductase [Marinilongibacter aquaticus]
MPTRRDFIRNMAMSSIVLPIGMQFPKAKAQKLRVALVGLGRYARLLADAIMVSSHCELKGLVTGTPSKEEEWGKKYNVPKRNIYNYQNFDEIASNKEIDLIYIVLPNGMHMEYAVRAAKAGKHVMVEKPMATNAADCKVIIEACEKAGVQLGVGYRLHFEPYNMEMMRLGQEKVLGEVRLVDASLGYNIEQTDPNDWHLNKKLAGGGALQNLGVYCVQAARYITGLEPVSVKAEYGPKHFPELFKEVEETLYWQLHFENKAVATSTASYVYGIDRLYASASQGHFELSPAISYGPFRGRSNQAEFDFPQTNQQQVQMDKIAQYILAEKPLPDHISGYEGLRDLKVMDAIYRAAETGKRVSI